MRRGCVEEVQDLDIPLELHGLKVNSSDRNRTAVFLKKARCAPLDRSVPYFKELTWLIWHDQEYARLENRP